MIIRQLIYLDALAREKHFRRAAEACHVSQPTLSAAIVQLEEELGVLIVERGRRFQGLTKEGEAVLAHARRILAEADLMKESIAELKEGVSGRIRLGAIPTALPMVAHITAPFSSRYPAVSLTVLSLTSNEIQEPHRQFRARCRPDLSRQRAARPRHLEADLPGILCAADARGRPARRTRTHQLGRGRRAQALPPDLGHAEPAHHRRHFPLGRATRRDRRSRPIRSSTSARMPASRASPASSRCNCWSSSACRSAPRRCRWSSPTRSARSA